MFHSIIAGILLGLGAAIPIGPLNLEIVRRNLHQGTRCGIALGLGACSADLSYLILLATSAVLILSHSIALGLVGVLGSLVLAWFGISALQVHKSDKKSIVENQLIKKKNLLRHMSEGYLLTLLNPYTILFWSSVSSQIATITGREIYPTILAGIGVIIGTVGWVIFLNILLHHTRHKLSSHAMAWLNKLGGIILLAFATYGLYEAIFTHLLAT